MKRSISLKLLTLLAPALASAAPCFQQGSYNGRGFWFGADGKGSSYIVRSEMNDSQSARSIYDMSEGNQVTLEVAVKGDDIFIDGNTESSGKAQCQNAATNLTLKIKAENKEVELKEEWLFVGNYLIRQGTKISGGQKINYQELLIKR
jgi:hypothetical protein